MSFPQAFRAEHFHWQCDPTESNPWAAPKTVGINPELHTVFRVEHSKQHFDEMFPVEHSGKVFRPEHFCGKQRL
jgi:hypothetical protein